MKKSFGDFFKQQIKDEDNRKLLERMNSLETVTEDGPQTKRPSKTILRILSPALFEPRTINLGTMRRVWLIDLFLTLFLELTYKHAEARCGFDHDQVGTLSKQEWECASLYVVFAFKKE